MDRRNSPLTSFLLRFRGAWRKIIMALAVVVVACTICALALPAMTMEQDQSVEPDMDFQPALQLDPVEEPDSTVESPEEESFPGSAQEEIAVQSEERTLEQPLPSPSPSPSAIASDPYADVETQADWEATLAGVTLTGDWSRDVLAVAESQLGYTESTRNFIVDASGQVQGYTRYGAWYGNPYGDWCAMFVSFCLHYAQVESIPLDASCVTWVQTLAAPWYDLYRTAAAYTPQPGDLIFFDQNYNGSSDHVGLVAEILPATDSLPTRIRVIEGNSNKRVQYVTYTINDSRIQGYGMLPQEPDADPSEDLLQQFTYENDVLSVTVDLPEDAGLPADTVLYAGQLPSDNSIYPYLAHQAQDALEREDAEVFLYYVSFYTPEGTYRSMPEGASITLQFQEPVPVQPGITLSVLHYGADGTLPSPLKEVTETRDADGALCCLAFPAKGSSLFAVMAVPGGTEEEPSAEPSDPSEEPAEEPADAPAEDPSQEPEEDEPAAPDPAEDSALEPADSLTYDPPSLTTAATAPLVVTKSFPGLTASQTEDVLADYQIELRLQSGSAYTTLESGSSTAGLSEYQGCDSSGTAMWTVWLPLGEHVTLTEQNPSVDGFRFASYSIIDGSSPSVYPGPEAGYAVAQAAHNSIYDVVGGTTGQVAFRSTYTALGDAAISLLARNTATGTVMQDVAFTLSREGTVLQTAKTDTAGRADFTGLSAGTYTLAETVPAGFADLAPLTAEVSIPAGDSHASITVTNGSTTVTGTDSVLCTVENTPAPGTLILEQVFQGIDAEQVAALADYRITLTQGETPVALLTLTGDGGTAPSYCAPDGLRFSWVVTGLEDGAITVTECGYLCCPDTAVTVQITDAGGISTVDPALDSETASVTFPAAGTSRVVLTNTYASAPALLTLEEDTSTGMTLPATGGPGSVPALLGGALLLAAALLLLLRRREKSRPDRH